MNKLKVMPLFEIEGTQFIVDVEKQVLREFQNPSNEISFLDDMTDRQSHYELRYNPGTNSVAEKHLTMDEVINIDVPQLTRLDPENMSRRYGVPVEQLKDKPDFEVIVDQEALALRRTGKLPLIDINGEDFVVDLRMQELRHSEYFYPILSLRSFELTEDGWHYTAFYEPIMKQVIELDPKLIEFPPHIFQIKIPNEIGLDPVATAREYGMDEKELLRRYPIEKDLKAEIIPLSETNIPRLIQQNKEKLQSEHQENMKKVKPRIRPKF
jgi:hypothetical protein